MSVCPMLCRMVLPIFSFLIGHIQPNIDAFSNRNTSFQCLSTREFRALFNYQRNNLTSQTPRRKNKSEILQISNPQVSSLSELQSSQPVPSFIFTHLGYACVLCVHVEPFRNRPSTHQSQLGINVPCDRVSPNTTELHKLAWHIISVQEERHPFGLAYDLFRCKRRPFPL